MRSDGLLGFVGDWWICVPLTLGVIVGGIGVPVLHEIGRELRRPAAWSTHTRITVWGTVVLLAVGFVAVLVLEWGNAGTLGPRDVAGKILAAFVSWRNATGAMEALLGRRVAGKVSYMSTSIRS